MTIPVDQSRGCSFVSLTDDDIAEGTQTFSISIENASPPAVFEFTEMVVVKIMDDDSKLE